KCKIKNESFHKRVFFMKALVLAAGRGTRMEELTADRPKPMVPLAGKPILEHILVGLREAGAREFVVVTGYRAEVLETYFGDGRRWDVFIQYRRQETQNGNAKAIQLAQDAMGSEPFFLTFGDIILHPANYRRVAESFRRQPADLLMTLVWLEDVSHHSSVIFDEDGRVRDIIEKPDPAQVKSHWNSAALFMARPALFDYTARLAPSERGEYELTDAIRAMAYDPARLVRGEKVEGYWGDLADAEELRRMEERMREEGQAI
ncbi:MAG: sugar phosphate nucleotidyltransferase, partial [Candidatus Sumerlaeota bacterium]|nr:sugar phosphate nucleotidyltransferase [Candidatus Sumerlaeota bacterium]